MNFTRTDNILKMMLLLKSQPNQMMLKEDLFKAIGKSRSTTYKIIKEFSEWKHQRPAPFILVGEHVFLNSDYC